MNEEQKGNQGREPDFVEEHAKAHFLRIVEQMGNNAVLMRRGDGDRLETVFVTRGFAEMMECDEAEAMRLMDGLRFLKTTNPEDRPLVRSMLKNQVAYDGTSSLIIQKITAKKNRVWCNVHYSFIEEFGERYVYCTYSDVTALKQYEDRLRSTYSSLGNNFYQVNDRTLAMLRVNLTRDAFEEVKGRDLYESDSITYSYSESIRRRAAHFPIRSERERFLRRFDREKMIAGYREGRNTVTQTAYSLRRDGSSCFVNLSAAITRHPLTGELIAFLTEQECNSVKVKETLTDKILAQQFDMVCYLVNGQYGVTIGQTAHVRRGNIFPAVNNGDYQSYLDHQVYPVLSGTAQEQVTMRRALALETVEEELRHREPYVVDIAIELEGEVFYKQFDFYSIDPDARFYILLKSDTTELQRQHRDLNEQLRTALEAANQASVAKTAFLSSMSHEIRTPMNAIIGLDSLALNEPDLPAKTRDQLEKIGASARHLLGLINDILDMSRIESGRMVLRREEFFFADMMEEINTMIGAQCLEKGLVYESLVDEAAEGYYEGDALKVKQVLINILGNAVKFTPAPGKVSFRAGITAENTRHRVLRFEIQDTGIGMDAAFLPQIFEPFSQEKTGGSNQYGSTGLGMAITRNIVEMMNGTISVESEKGVGTTFTVTITLRKGEKKREEAPAQEAAEAGKEKVPEAAGLQGRRILLAEDVVINAEIMKEILRIRGMEAEHAENGQIAVEMYLAHPVGYYDAVLMDLRMPVMDGLTAAGKIRSAGREDSKTLPIIALTANAFDEDVQQTLRAGMNAHLSKPVEPEKIYETLESLIRP